MELRPGYKKTDVGVIPEDWDVRKIRQICKLINGRGFKPHEWGTRGFPIIRIQNLNGSEEFNYFDGAFNNKILVEDGQLLFAWSGSRGTSFGPHIWRGQTAVLNYHTWKVNVSDQGVDPDFFYYALRHLTEFIEENAHGASALVHTQKWEMEGFDVAVPQRTSEQEAIAEALSDVDASIAALSRLIAKKRDLRQGAMQRLLTGQARLPGFTAPWQEKRLGELARVFRGASPRPIENPIWFDQNSTVGWVRISDVSRSKVFLYETTQRLSPAGIARSRRVPIGSLIMSIAATVGRPAITAIDTCIHDGFVVFQDLDIDQLLLFYLLKFIEPNWSLHGQTGSQMNLNTGIIESADLKLPTDRDEQAAIGRILSDMDAELSALDARLEKTRALKQAMMQALLTGRVRLPVPRDVAPQTKEGAHV